jgi:hypothetical protein
MLDFNKRRGAVESALRDSPDERIALPGVYVRTREPVDERTRTGWLGRIRSSSLFEAR